MPAAISLQPQDVPAGNMQELYWLTYLLTGDRDHSEAAFMNTLVRDEENPRLGAFMLEWARKLVISSALGTIQPELRKSAARMGSTPERLHPGYTPWMAGGSLTKMDLERAILAIDTFPRCALLLTNLVGMPASDAAILLGVETKLVKAAQAAGLRELARNIAHGTSETLEAA
jgi:DNA-directed RNA polymerase specialized sigma24 family protein